MSQTYKAARDGLVHGAHYFNYRGAEHEIDTWCGDTYRIDADRVRGGLAEGAVITCIRCLDAHLRYLAGRAAERAAYGVDIRKILEDNSVKDLQQVTDQRYLDEVDAAIAKVRAG